VAKLDIYGPKRGKEEDFWDRYSDEIRDSDDDSDEDLNDGEWEEFED